MFLHHRPVLESVNAFLQVPWDSVIQIEERLPWATYLPCRRIKLPLQGPYLLLRGDAMRKKKCRIWNPEYDTQSWSMAVIDSVPVNGNLTHSELLSGHVHTAANIHSVVSSPFRAKFYSLHTHTHLSENLHSTYNQINSQKIQVPTTMFIAVCTDPKWATNPDFNIHLRCFSLLCVRCYRNYRESSTILTYSYSQILLEKKRTRTSVKN